MKDIATWLPALTGLLGVIVGSLIGLLGKLVDENIRRANRRETYAPIVFEKRLKVHERLAALINSGSEVASAVIEDDNLSLEDRHLLISDVILKIATFADQNSLYLNEELGVHCTAVFMSVESIHDADSTDKHQLISRYNSMRIDALRMISEESGIAAVSKLFKSINKPKLSGPIIERIRELREEQKRK